MSLEQKLSEKAVAVTGDESIMDVAILNPRGAAAKRGAGAAAGAAAGGAIGGDSTWGNAIGAGVGVGAGEAATALTSDLPLNVCVAISPDTVYLVGLPKFGLDDAYPIAQISRDRLGVEVHQRMSVRVVVLEDLDSGHQYELEAMRMNPYHAKALVEMLMMSDSYHDEEDEELAATES